MAEKTLLIDPSDDMAVALIDLKAGQSHTISGNAISLQQDVPRKHKFTIREFKNGESLKMYGVVVGKVLTDLPSGSLLTTENLVHATDPLSEASDKGFDWAAPDVSDLKDLTFKGYVRKDGSVGTRNYWVVIPMVFCENRNLEILKNALTERLGYGKSDKYKAFAESLTTSYVESGTIEKVNLADGANSTVQNRVFPNVDGIKFLTHSMGCGGTRQDSQALCGLLAGYVTNPNVAGATVLSLGCQHAQSDILREEITKRDPSFDKPLQVFEQQQYPNEEALMESAMKSIFQGLMDANKLERQEVSVAELCVGLECGASDGFSGISANPTVGQTSDYLVALGAKTILSEFPELAGVENNLISRAKNKQTAERFKTLMEAYSNAAERAGSGFDMNPSPGNIRDGLITDAIKSAGAAKKGGTAPVSDVLDYPEKAKSAGLNLLCTPGNDVESTTGLAAAGANLIFFTTGLGTPTGNPVCPVIKIATNTQLVQKISDIIDFDTGSIINGTNSLKELGKELIQLSLSVASGEVQTKAEQLGQNDFIPWKRGVSL